MIHQEGKCKQIPAKNVYKQEIILICDRINIHWKKSQSSFGTELYQYRTKLAASSFFFFIFLSPWLHDYKSVWQNQCVFTVFTDQIRNFFFFFASQIKSFETLKIKLDLSKFSYCKNLCAMCKESRMYVLTT